MFYYLRLRHIVAPSKNSSQEYIREDLRRFGSYQSATGSGLKAYRPVLLARSYLPNNSFECTSTGPDALSKPLNSNVELVEE